MLGSQARSGTLSGPLPRKVLVVDDEPDLADLAQALLGHHGMDVIVAHDAAQALRMLATHADVDALFSDVMMPGMTGLELAHATRTAYPEIRIVLTSGYTAPELLTGNATRYAFVAKPYRIADVVRLLRQS